MGTLHRQHTLDARRHRLSPPCGGSTVRVRGDVSSGTHLGHEALAIRELKAVMPYGGYGV